LSRRTISRDVLISNPVRAQIIQIEKSSKQIGKANRRGNIAVLAGAAAAFPFLVSDCAEDALPVVVMSVVFKFVPRLSGSVGVQEKEAFDRLF